VSDQWSIHESPPSVIASWVDPTTLCHEGHDYQSASGFLYCRRCAAIRVLPFASVVGCTCHPSNGYTSGENICA